MLKRSITYTDFNDNIVTEDFYFNLSEAELMEMESTYRGGYAETMQRIIDTEDNAALVQEFKKLVLLAYGEKSEDGKRFVKSDEIDRNFSQHAAYSALFMELATDAQKAAAFMNGIIPKRLVQEIDQDKPLMPPAPPQSETSPSA